jgi:hypothetical protein
MIRIPLARFPFPDPNPDLTEKVIERHLPGDFFA